MSHKVALLLVFVAALVFVSAQPTAEQSAQCGPNEEFHNCGSKCVSTCDKPAPPICTMECVIGCQCKQGFVRNKSNQCVLTRDC